MKKFLILSFLMVLGSCIQHTTKDESSPFYSVAKGSYLLLNQPLTIPPGKASTIVQNGAVVSGEALDIYMPNCVFEINTLKEIPQTIQPDTFLIYKVVDEMLSVSLKKKMFASRTFMSDGGPSDFNYSTTMYLESKQQPDVLRLACMHWESPEDNNYLTIKQMRQAMGEIFTLKLIN